MRPPMPNANRKQVAHHLIENLPDDATYDDMMRELYERQAIERGLADSDADRVTDNKLKVVWTDEAKAHLAGIHEFIKHDAPFYAARRSISSRGALTS